MGPALDALNGIGLVQLSLSMSKTIREEHGVSLALSLRHVLRLLVQVHNAVVAVPGTSSPPPP